MKNAPLCKAGRFFYKISVQNYVQPMYKAGYAAEKGKDDIKPESIIDLSILHIYSKGRKKKT